MNEQDFTRANNLRCPRCQLSHTKKNGHTYYGKQNYQSLLCDRQFVIKNETVSQQKQELIKSLLLERISLRGICRVLKVSLSWLLNFVEQLYQSTPEDLQFAAPRAVEIELFCLEADELWSFVERRENKRSHLAGSGTSHAADCRAAHRRPLAGFGTRALGESSFDNQNSGAGFDRLLGRLRFGDSDQPARRL
jgi:transposase-like protein